MIDKHIKSVVSCAMICAFALPVFFLGSAAWAGDKLETEDRQKLVQDVMIACLQKKDPVAWDACVGVPAASCVESMRPASASQETVCIREELRQWEIQVKGAYARLESDARWRINKRPIDAEQIEMDLNAMQSLRTDWIRFRKSACSYIKTFWGDDSKYGQLEVSRCEMQIAADHAIWLYQSTERYLVD